MNISLPEFLHHWPELLRHPRLPDVTAVLLGVASLYGAAQLSWQLVALAMPAEASLPVSTLALASGARSNANQLANLSLFGGQQEATPYGSTSMMDAPDTQLNIKLLGIIASSNPNIARAIIAPAGGQEAYYAVGASLQGGAVIRAIYDDRVILEYNGRYEALRMPKEILAVITPGVKKNSTKPSTGAADEIKVALNATEIQDYKNKLLSNPSSLQGKIRMRSVSENGRIKGIRVYPGTDVPLFNKLGLKGGDMITSINGTPVGDTAAMTNIYSQLGSLPEVRVEIERMGQKKFIKLPLNR